MFSFLEKLLNRFISLFSMDFYFGRHCGEPVEYVGVVDYCYLDWAQRVADNCSPELRREIVRVRDILNSFTPTKPCQSRCSRTASRITLVDNVGITQVVGVSVSSEEVWCEKHAPANQSCDGVTVYPIKFDILLEYPHNPPSIRRDIANVLLELSGWPKGKIKNRKEIVQHVNSLEGRVQPGGQLRLF